MSGLFRCAHSRLPDGSWIDWFSRSYLTGFLGLKRPVFWVLIDRFSGSLTDRFSVVTDWPVFWVLIDRFSGSVSDRFSVVTEWPVFWVLIGRFSGSLIDRFSVVTDWPVFWVSARPPSWGQKSTAIIYRFSEYTKRSCCLQGMNSLVGISRTRRLSSQDIWYEVVVMLEHFNAAYRQL